ncbi:TetR/AcrR family transcriptional regulator [Planotetraspora thailandica]
MICDRAGVTRGAFYHHFSNKEQIFREVYAAEQEKLAVIVRRAFQAVKAGCIPSAPWSRPPHCCTAGSGIMSWRSGPRRRCPRLEHHLPRGRRSAAAA